MTTCTRCESSGFLNIEQVPEQIAEEGFEAIKKWMNENSDHDVMVCDCCGDGEGWHGEPGSHYSSDDPPGQKGPYAYNGGLCECH